MSSSSSAPPLSIPLISLLPSKPASVLAQEVSSACKTSGFLYITDHGIPQAQIDKAFEISSQFFEGEEQNEKEKVAITVGNKGWTQVRQESLDPSTAKKGDLHESFYLSKLDGAEDQPLPPTFAAKKKELAAFFEATHDLCLRILSSFALSLSLPPTFFDSLHPGVSDRLRFLHYPPHTPTSNEQDARSGAHSDYGSITILFQHEVGGLQVLLPSSTSSNDETWVEAPIIPNALLVNVGDAFEFWSSGLFKSTVHRVPLPSEAAPRRYSIAYFCQPGDDVVLKSLVEGGVKEEDEERWREIMAKKGLLKRDGTVVETLTAGEHLQMRLAGSYKGRKEE